MTADRLHTTAAFLDDMAREWAGPNTRWLEQNAAAIRREYEDMLKEREQDDTATTR